jgi:hypothetical protein
MKAQLRQIVMGSYSKAPTPMFKTVWPYRYAWNKCGRKDQPCKVTARGGMNSCRVEFPDGFKMITSRNALRKWK